MRGLMLTIMQLTAVRRRVVAVMLCLFGAIACRSLPADEPEAPRPRLQILNGSDEPIEVFWVRDDGQRVSNGTIAPGRNDIIDTTLGHVFVVVGKRTGTERDVTCRVRIQGMRYDTDDVDGVPKIYTQRYSAGGFPVVATDRVNSYALREAVHLIDMMLAERPDVREAMIASGARMCVMAHNEYTTDLPEFGWLRPKEYWDARARGLGGSETDPFCSCGEENLLGYDGDPYATECILIHEFAHNIHLRGLLNVDPTFDERLKATYDRAMAAGLWRGKYAATNHHEYFAEGVQSWFDNNREHDHDHNHVNTREELRAYDPGLAAMCEEVFGSTELKYTKPVTRLEAHLEGYDPSVSPRFQWPERLDQSRSEIRKKAVKRDAEANSGE